MRDFWGVLQCCQAGKDPELESLLVRALAPSPVVSSLSTSRWLCNTAIDTRTRRWAVEGLAYLTLDADVKDDFVQDIPALQAMFELAKARTVQISKLRKGCWPWCSGPPW